MKFELKRLTDYSKKSIIEEINRVDKLLNKEILKATDIKKYSKVGLTTIRRKFGSLEMAYMEAGIGYKYPSKYVNKKVNTGKSKRLTNEEIISELQRLAGNKKIITVEELRNNCPLFGYELVLSRFGTWKNALRLAELEIGKHAIRYTNNECFENLLTVWTYYGNIPKYRDMNLPPSVVGGKAYLSKWGTWNKALQAFINFVTKEPNNTAPTTLHEQTPSSTSNYKSKTVTSLLIIPSVLAGVFLIFNVFIAFS